MPEKSFYQQLELGIFIPDSISLAYHEIRFFKMFIKHMIKIQNKWPKNKPR